MVRKDPDPVVDLIGRLLVACGHEPCGRCGVRPRVTSFSCERCRVSDRDAHRDRKGGLKLRTSCTNCGEHGHNSRHCERRMGVLGLLLKKRRD